MFKNVGKQIKNIAQAIYILSIGISILVAIRFIETYSFISIIIVAVCCFAGLFVSICLYGFGELIDKTASNSENTARILSILESMYGNEHGIDSQRETEDNDFPVKHIL